MVSKNSSYHLVIEEYDKLNNKSIRELDINNYLKDNDSILFYAFILHDKDIDESGELVHKHYHLVVKLNNSYSKSTIINDIASHLLINKSCIQCRKLRDFILSVQYLIHKNDKDKYQYDFIDIWTSDTNEMMKIVFDSVSSYDIDIDYLIELVNNCGSLTQVYRELGLSKSRTYRSLIVDLWKERHL